MTAPSTSVAADLLRAPRTVANAIAEGRSIRGIASTSIVAIVVGTASYGAVVGSVRGGPQIAFAAAKMPLVSLLTLSLLAPFLAGVSAALDRPIGLARSSTIVLAATARAALVLLALAPFVALMLAVAPSYHDEVLFAAVGFGLAGLAGLGLLRHAVSEGEHPGLVRALVVIGFVIVSAQSAWVLRPWVSRPSSAIVFVRAPEGAVAEELVRSGRSAVGDYDPARSRHRAAERAASGWGSQ